MNESERIRSMLGVSRAEFSRRYHIPIRTLEDWDWGKKTPPVYVLRLLEQRVKDDIVYSKWVGRLYEINGIEYSLLDYNDMVFTLNSGDKVLRLTPDELADIGRDIFY